MSSACVAQEPVDLTEAGKAERLELGPWLLQMNHNVQWFVWW
jgi:hypothetical protein